MNCFEKQSPMLGNGYPQWNLGYQNGSFAEFSNTRNGLQDFPYLQSTETDLTPYASTLSLAPAQSSYQEDDTAIAACLAGDGTIPSTVYSNYSSSSTSIDPLSLVCPTIPDLMQVSTKNRWSNEDSRSHRNPCPSDYGMPPSSYDGLPGNNYQQEQQQQVFGDVWNSNSANSWTSHSQSVALATISPKQLTLNVSSAPLSSSGSSQGSMLSLSNSSASSSSGEDQSDFSGPETLAVEEQPITFRRPRQVLPDSIPHPQRIVPTLGSTNFVTTKTTKKSNMKVKLESHRRRRSSPTYSNSCLSTNIVPLKYEPAPGRSGLPKKIEPKPKDHDGQRPWNDTPQSAATVQAMHHRDAKDDFLVRSKLAGMSYKDIRRQGGFTEAESTLRGRFRTLTKHKTARVRKPEWNDNDVCI